MKDLLTFILSHLTTSADSFEINEQEDPDAITFSIKLQEGDHGTIIGRGGKTINSIRTLLTVYQSLHDDHKRVFLNVE